MRVESPSAEKYYRHRKGMALVSFLLPVFLFVLFVASGLSKEVQAVVLEIASNYYVALLLYWGLVYLTLNSVMVIAGWVWFKVEKSHGLTHQSLSSWFIDYCRYRVLTWAASSVAIVWFYWAVRTSPGHWWLLFWPALVSYHAMLLVLMDSLFLPLFFKVTPLPADELHERLSMLASRAHITRPEFSVLHVGHKTSRSNAVALGLPGKYKILVTDTVIETFTPEEVEAVVAHEIGHQAQHHTTKRLLILSILYLLALWVSQWPVAGFLDDVADFSYLPCLVVAFTCAQQYVLIIFGVFACAHEKSADRFSWALTQNVPAFVSMLRKIAAQNLIPTGRRGASTHPAVDERIKAAEKFLQEQQQNLAVPTAG